MSTIILKWILAESHYVLFIFEYDISDVVRSGAYISFEFDYRLTHSLEELSIMLFQYTTRVKFYDLYYYVNVQCTFDRQLDPFRRKKHSRFKILHYRCVTSRIGTSLESDITRMKHGK